MISFLSQTLQELKKTHKDLSSLIFILPSKRAGAFLQQELANLIDKPVFAPTVLSIEEFSEKVAQLETLDSTTTLFEFYSIYKQCTEPEKTEDFENFSTWAQTLIHDFNEIDRYLIPPEKILNYLSEIQDINHWSLQPEKTELVKNYLFFWKKLPVYYQNLRENLLKNGRGYQGLVYRYASEKITDYARENKSKHVFVGFNALNNAEQLIIQQMLKKGSEIFWDIDKLHFNNPAHDASLFIREYARSWDFYKDNKFSFISNNYSKEKNIEIIGVPKNIGQAKYVGELLASKSKEELNSTAVVLGDESLLLPVLNSVPPNVESINVTMGYPLGSTPLAYFFEKLFEIFKLENNRFYYKDIIAILGHPVIIKATGKNSAEIVNKIKKENLLYLRSEEITDLFSKDWKLLISLCFPSSKIHPDKALENFSKIITIVKTSMENNEEFTLETLYRYNIVLEELNKLFDSYPHMVSISSLHHFFKEISSRQTLDFQGKPFQGLQLMGMLESRVLDFETVILTSVNEGTLPAGKSNNSFIPYDLKKAYNLPTYKEKDAVYTYHFYHLLQRAKNVYLLHNSDTESQMGGEKSRFLIQLQVDNLPQHHLKEITLIPEVSLVEQQLQKVEKTPEILERIRQIAENGFSPSSLTTYIRNPLDFYKQYVLKIKDKEEVEETVAYNTLGTVVHETLRAFYAPLTCKNLTLEQLRVFQEKIAEEVTVQFENSYSKVPLDKGKNLLIFEVAKRYVSNFLKTEIKALEAGFNPEIKQIEANLITLLDIPELNFPVRIKGNVDRVDLVNGVLRIIDYKTGKVEQNQLEICDWNEITTDYDKYSKPFQVLMYATMLLNDKTFEYPVEAGVISFKNLKQAFLKFAKKENPRDRNKDYNIGQETLENFKEQLKNLILEICDPKIPFIEKEIKKGYGNY